MNSQDLEYWTLGADFLASGNYIAVNKTLIQQYGLEAAVVVGELASEMLYYRDNGQLNDGWFYATVENMERKTGLSGYQQRKVMDVLTKEGFVEVDYRDTPRKRYVRISLVRIMQVINHLKSKISTTREPEILQPQAENFYANKTQEVTPKTTPKNKTKKMLVPPTIEEVRDYVKENGFIFDADEFFSYYASQGWKKANGQKVVSWKQCCVTWERREQGRNGKQPRKSQRQIDFSEYEQPKLGSKRYNSMTDVTEVYKGNGVWEIQQPTLFEGERYEDIAYDL